MKKSNVKDAVVAITYNCNAKCQMCNIWQNKALDELKVKDFDNFPKTIKRINITGGEPFLNNEIVSIIKRLKNINPKSNIIISSNGFATNLISERMKEIIEIDPNIGIAVSVDGVGGRHDKIRGVEGGFSKVINTLDNLKALGVKRLKISFTIGDYNYSGLRIVYELARKYDAEFTTTVVHSSENYFAKENKVEKKKEIIRMLDWLIKEELKSKKVKQWGRAYYLHGLKEFLKTGERILPDYSGGENIFIDPKGDIYPNDISNNKIGHIEDYKLSEASDEDIQKMQDSWMLCTVRQAMLRNPHKVLPWIMMNR